MDCLFCKIAQAQIETDYLYENKHILAFRDVHPQAPQHILIIPRQHIATLNDLDESNNTLLGDMILTAKTLATEMDFADKGYRILMNCNADGGQTIYHIHLHLLAGRAMHWPPG